MSETNIAVTPGSGALIDVETTTNGNLRQVVCIGDPTVNANVVTVSSTGAIVAQDASELNRFRLVLSADAITSVTTEAMMIFQSYRAGTVTSGITSYTVTSGKTFRIQNMSFKVRPTTPSTTVTFGNTVFRLREGNTITSPLIASFPVLMQTNVDSNPTVITTADGLEFPSGTVLGISHLASATTILENFNIVGFEY